MTNCESPLRRTSPLNRPLPSLEFFDADPHALLSSTDNIVETLSFLREKGKHVAFVTNNATSSRKQFQKKFKDFGIDVELSNIVTSGSATAQHLKEVILPKREKEGKKTGIYLIGQEAIEEELRECGLKWKGGTVSLLSRPMSSMTDESVSVVHGGRRLTQMSRLLLY